MWDIRNKQAKEKKKQTGKSRNRLLTIEKKLMVTRMEMDLRDELNK